ncbi:HAD family hydrolase [Spirosoma sp. KUDC1026]|uniref:HAD family hydrolase n=1 Tax=Spirosoma sp. KUDC1026 TaxID=2745947 RepID=UPI00159BC420|nr:HAD family hydrolase [Spirosoma sp. KUDC1026]QKZ11601.1 HAD family hydrolase [Spirosoma sp. KUDC1026]
MLRPESLKLIAFDADDTLWVNEPNYVNVQQTLSELLAHYVDPKQMIDRFYVTQIKNLDLFGYGAKGFMLSMIETAIELTNGAVTGAEIQQIIDVSKSLLNYPIDVLDGVHEVLDTLSRRYDLMIITKGDLFDQESKIARSGVGNYFKHMEIVSEKDPAAYRRILQRYGIQPSEFLMIGNSVKSDILPVLEIGAWAVHVPFEITWGHELVPGERLAGRTFPRMTTIREVLTWLDLPESAC